METFPHKTLNPFITFDLHDGPFVAPPAPLPVPGKAIHIGAGVLILAYGIGTNKDNKGEVYADGLRVISRGHTVKHVVVPHLNLYPFTPFQPNVRIYSLIWKSTNACKLAVYSVSGPHEEIAVSLPGVKYIGLNEACNDQPLKAVGFTSIVINWGTVILGFTIWDLLRSIFDHYMQMLINYVCSKLSDKFMKWLKNSKWFKKLQEKLAKSFLKKVVKSVLGVFGKSKVYRDAMGRFASVSERIIKDAVDTAVGKATDKALSYVKKPVSTASDRIGEHLFGQSESLSSPAAGSGH